MAKPQGFRAATPVRPLLVAHVGGEPGAYRRRGDGRMFIPRTPPVCQQHADRGDVVMGVSAVVGGGRLADGARGIWLAAPPGHLGHMAGDRPAASAGSQGGGACCLDGGTVGDCYGVVGESPVEAAQPGEVGGLGAGAGPRPVGL
jgi:hypothetical protein